MEIWQAKADLGLVICFLEIRCALKPHTKGKIIESNSLKKDLGIKIGKF